MVLDKFGIRTPLHPPDRVSEEQQEAFNSIKNLIEIEDRSRLKKAVKTASLATLETIMVTKDLGEAIRKTSFLQFVCLTFLYGL